MSLGIAGLGWVTPLGSQIDSVWDRLCAGEEAVARDLSSSLGDQVYAAYLATADATASLPPHPRLRRSSAISRFAAVAGLAALRDAGIEMNEVVARRTALIFAISNGGVVYTKRFYHEIVAIGAQAASPLLFPETVFNAPASHLAAILGITGTSYTLVGDGAVGLLAIKMAEDLMHDESLDQCLVVGAEEADWLLCDAYRRWRLLRQRPPIELFADAPRGTVLSEGAGAIVVGRRGDVQLEAVHPGLNFRAQHGAAAGVAEVMGWFSRYDVDFISVSANGTFIDAAERTAIERYYPRAAIYAVKGALGDSVGAGSLWQVICAALGLHRNQIPGNLHVPGRSGAQLAAIPDQRPPFRRSLVCACGMNQQIAGLVLSLAK